MSVLGAAAFASLDVSELTLPYFSVVPFPLHSAASSVSRTSRKGVGFVFLFFWSELEVQIKAQG